MLPMLWSKERHSAGQYTTWKLVPLIDYVGLPFLLIHITQQGVKLIHGLRSLVEDLK